jgi:elongation factor G
MFTGIIGDLSAKRGRVHGTRTVAGNVVVVAGQVPLSELNGYQSRLNAIAGGHGNYSIELSRYDPVPPAQQERMASQHKNKAAVRRLKWHVGTS